MTQRADPVDLEELRRLAEAATPGPWKADLDVFDPDEPEVEACVSDESLDFLATIGTGVTVRGGAWPEGIEDTQAVKNSRYIAAANPATILALIEEVERLREQARGG